MRLIIVEIRVLTDTRLQTQIRIHYLLSTYVLLLARYKTQGIPECIYRCDCAGEARMERGLAEAKEWKGLRRRRTIKEDCN